MKKKFLYALAALMVLPFASCKDDEDMGKIDASEDLERMPMTMFRMEENTNIKDDPYATKVITDSLNSVILTWFGVEGAAGYQIRYGLQAGLTSGEESDWNDPTKIIEDVTFGPNVTSYQIDHLEYSTAYRFAIRVLSPKGEKYHSKWYGHGHGREWAEQCGLTTEERYPTPDILTLENKDYSTIRVSFNFDVENAGKHPWEATGGSWSDKFEIKDGKFVAQKLIAKPSPSNPDAQIDSKWLDYTLTTEDLERGWIEITGLDRNSFYLIDVKNENIPYEADAKYNTLAPRTKGDPGEPIYITHYCDPNDTIRGAAEFNACRLDTIITNFTNDNSLAEGQVFYLDGGKAYYFEGNQTLCKGFKLATNPEDVAAGKRAKVYMGGIGKEGESVRSNNFMFGRQPLQGEADAPIFVESLIFEDIDFDCPLAKNYGEGSAQGNYFANMYSNGMGVTFESVEIRNCTFQRMIRGFVRVQGSKVKRFNKFIVEGNVFYNCGYYDNNGRGYAWVAGDGASAKSNIYRDMIWRNNTFYDSPRTCLFTDNGKDLPWGDDVHYNITLENNTFINYSTRSKDRHIFDFKFIPGGSKIVAKKNLIVLAADDNDQRKLFQSGMSIQNVNGSGELTLDVADNYSVGCRDDHMKDDGIFTGQAFSAKKNAGGAYWDGIPGLLSGNFEDLIVKVGSKALKATDLFVNPNPRHVAHDPTKKHGDDHRAPDNIWDALKYKQTTDVTTHEIYTKGIGDPRWRN